MKRLLLLLLVFTLLPAALGVSGAEVFIQAPTTALPGETVAVSIEAQIQGVRVISFPLEVTLIYPDQTTTTLPIQPDGQGLLTTTAYTPLQGVYELRAQASFADTQVQATHEIRVQPPPLQANITRSNDTFFFNATEEYTFNIYPLLLQAGPITQQEPVCTVTCTSCELVCAVNNAFITAQGQYRYTQILAPTSTQILTTGQSIDTQELFLLREEALIALPSKTSFVQDQTLITPEGVLEIRVLDEEELSTLPEAYSILDGQWYVRSTQPLTALNHTILAAWSLQGELLEHTTNTLQTSTGFEARIQRTGSAQLPVVTHTEHGVLVNNLTQLLRLPATATPISLSQEPELLVSRDEQGHLVYYAQEDHVLIPANLTNNTVLYARTFEPIKLPVTNASKTTILNEELEVVLAQEGTLTQWTPRVQPGRYFVLAQQEQPAVQVVDVLPAGELITSPNNNTYAAQPNTQLVIKREVRNTDTQPRTINVQLTGDSRAVLYANNKQLTDTNLNGVLDTGILRPGEAITLSAHVFIAAQQQDQTLKWTFSTPQASITRSDEIRIASESSFIQVDDVEVAQITASQASIEVVINNYDVQERVETIRLTYQTREGEDAEQFSVALPAGSSTHTFTTPPNTYQVRAELLVTDQNPSNDYRLLRFNEESGLLVHVNEYQNRAHEAFTVKVQAPLGAYQAFIPASNGSLLQVPTATLSQQARTQDLLVQLPLEKNTDVQLVLIPGEERTFNPYLILDNRDATTKGSWFSASQVPGFYGPDYLNDLNERKGDKEVVYSPVSTARYEVEIHHPGDSSFASNTRVLLGEDTVLVNQKVPSSWRYLGRYELGVDNPIIITNAASNGVVVADAFRLVRVDQYATIAQESIVTTARRGIIFDSRGREVAAQVSLREDGRDVRAGLLPRQAQANNRNYEILFEFEDEAVDNLRVHNANPSAMGLGLERVPVARAQQFTARSVVDSFAIDPQFESDYSFTRTATGRELLKCTDYDFTNQECLGSFEHVMFLTPGEKYTATLDPLDPLFVEVNDLTIPPVSAVCSDDDPANWDPSVCQGTYTNNPTCGSSGARILCDDGVVESLSGGRPDVLGVDARYADVTVDPSEQCDNILSVSLEYRWSSPTGNVNNRRVEISTEDNPTWTNPTGCSTNFGLQSCDITSYQSWSCEDFFGENTQTRARAYGWRSTGPGSHPTTVNVDYLVFVVDYEFEVQPFTSDFSSYRQGAFATFTGANVWGANEDVRINVTREGSLINQLDVLTDAEGEFSVQYEIDSYANTGSWRAVVWQLSNNSIVYDRNFTVTLRNPSVAPARTGGYYNRSETATFIGSQWANNATVLVTATDPESNEFVLDEINTTTSSTGQISYNWSVPADLSLLTGPYTFTFVEEDNSSFTRQTQAQIVILPTSATRWDSVDLLSEIYALDGTEAGVTYTGNTDGRFLNLTFPETFPEDIELNRFDFVFFYRESSGATGHHIQWWDGASWSTICTPPTSTSQTNYTCSLLGEVASDPSLANNVQIRLTDNDATSGGAGTVHTYYVDIAFLDVNFTFPRPLVDLLSPANNSWFNSTQHELFFNASNEMFDISECRLYVNEALEYTNDSFTNPGTDSYTHTFSEGVNTWRAECTDDSARQLVGESETRDIIIDLTPPSTTISTPTNNSWFNTSTPSINFTLTDNLANPVNWSVYVNNSLDNSGVATNNTAFTHTLSSLADGYYEVVVEAWDPAFNYAVNESINLYVDTTAPVVTLNDPVDTFNTSSTSVEFSWTPTDNLAPTLSCDLFVDDVSQGTFATQNGVQNQTTIPGFSDGVYNWSVLCTDIAGNSALSEVREFTVDTTPPVVLLEAPLNETVFEDTRNIQLDYNVTDNLLPVTECRLYIDDELNQTNTTITQSVTQSFFLTNLDLGVYAWNVECVDLVGNADNSSQQEFEINLTMFSTSPANGFVVDRDGGGAAPESITFVANASDEEAGTLVSFYASLLEPVVAGQENLLLGTNTTTSSGVAEFTFTPDNSYFAGNYSWFAAANRYYNDTSNDFIILGTPTISYQDVLFDPNNEYNTSQLVRLNATVTSSPESASQLQTLYGLFVNATLTQPDSTQHYVPLTGAGNLSGTYALASDAQIGLWSALLNTSASWMYPNTTSLLSRTFTVKGFAHTISPPNGTVVDRDAAGMDPETLSLVVQIPGATAGETINFTADLTDPAFSGEQGLLLGTNTTNATGHATLSFTPTSSFYAGNYTWYAVSNVSYVGNTSTLLIKGGAQLARANVSEEPASEYNQSDTVQLRFNITSVKETQEELGINYSLVTNATLQPNTSSTPTYIPTLSFDGSSWVGSQAIGLTDPVGVWRVVANTSGLFTYQNQSVEYFFTVFGLTNLTVDTFGARVYEPVTFTANYSDTLNQPINYSQTLCEIRFDILGGYTSYENMSYDSSSGLFWFSRRFNETYTDAEYNIACNDPLYEFQNVTDTFTINRTFADVLTVPGQVVDRDAAGIDSETLLLEASIVEAPEGVSIEFYTNLTDPVLGQTEVFLGANTTDASGVAVYLWNPDGTIRAGNHTLYANATYADTRNVSDAQVFAALQSVFTNPVSNPDANYTQNQTVTLHANATTVGVETSDQLNTSYALSYTAYLTSVNGQDSSALAFINPLWQASYTLLDLAGVGVWNVSINASANYHYPDSSTKNFDVFGYMNVTHSSITPTDHFVYGSAAQTCVVQDQHTAVPVEDAQVFFYRNATLLGSNTTNSTGHAQFTFQTNSSGVFDVLCEVEDQLGIYYFAGQAPNSTDSLTVLPFPITPISPANDTLVDRDETNVSVPNTLELVVEVPSYVPDGVSINFYSNLTDPLSESAVLLGSNTTSSGTARLNYNPATASYAGLHEWYATNPDATVNGTRTYESIMSSEIVFTNTTQNPNLNYTQNESVTLQANLTSLGPETRTELATNYSSLLNFTLTNQNGQTISVAFYFDPLWQSSYTLLDLAGVGVWNVTASSVGDYQFDAVSSLRNFTVYGYMNLTQAVLDASSTHVYGLTTQTCTVQDQHTNVVVEDAQVFFYRNATLLGSNTTNVSGQASFIFQTNNTGVYDISCEVEDQLGIYYYAGDAPTATNTLTITPFPITPISPLNDTLVDRDETNVSVPNTIELVVQVPSYVPDAVTINFSSSLINPLTQAPTLLGANTTSSGTARLNYNPQSTSYAGLYVWNASSTNGFSNGSRTYQSIGTTNTSFFDETLFPGLVYEQNDSVTLQANLTSLGPETRTELATNYSSLLNFTLSSINGVNTSVATYNNPFWQSSYSLLDLAGVGVWNVTATAQTNYFFNSLSEQRNFTVYGFMNLSQTSPSNPQAYEFVPHTQTCTVQDQHTAVPVMDAQVFFYRNATFLGSNTTNSSGQASVTFATNTSGTYNLLCEVQDQLGIYYYAGDEPSQTTTLTVEPFLVTPTNPINDTLVDRDGFLVTPNTITLNVSVVEEIPAGITIYFYANLTNPSIAGQEELLLGTNTTTSNNWAALTYNPNSTTYLGEYVWWAQGGARGANGTRTFTQLGSMNVTFANSTINPDAEYDKPINVTIDALLQSYGPETNTQLSSLYAAATNNTFVIPNGTNQTISLMYNTVNWSGEYEIQTPDTRGWWFAQLNATANYFALVDAASRSFFVNNFPPTHTTPILNASDHPQNYTTANLTVHPQNVFDAEGDFVTNMTDWRIANQSVAVLNLPFLSKTNSTAAGAVRDYTTYEHNATLDSSGVNPTPTYIDSCIVGGCYFFDNNEYIDTTLTLNPASTSFTISLWARVESLPSTLGSSVPIVQQEDGTGVGRTLVGLSNNDDGWYSFYGGVFQDSGVVPALSQWYHVVYTYDLPSETLTFYIDANDIYSDQADPEVADGIWTLARHKSGANYYHGYLDHVLVLDRALSQEQIAQIREDGLAGKPPTTIVSEETNKEEVWSACLTPNDGLDDAVTLCSNEVRIRGLLEAINPANDTVVDRDATGQGNETINLTASTFGDAGINVSFFADLTDPLYAGQNNLLVGYAVSNATGFATLSYNPNSSIYAGNYTWRPEETNSTTLNNRTYLVYGSLQASYNSTAHPNSTYNQTQTALFTLNLTSPGPETPLDINNTQDFLFEQILTLPNATNATLTTTFTNPHHTSNYTFSATETVGVWNTSVFASARFFYSLEEQLRTFTLRGVSTLEVFDEQDIIPRTVWTGEEVLHFANWTHLDATPVDTGTCTLTLWNNTQIPMSYNSSNELWVANHSYEFAGIFRYNATCTRPFYYDVFDNNNISIATNVSLVANYSSQVLSDALREVTLRVTNLRGHVEGNVTLYTVLHPSLTPSYNTAPTATQSITGEYAGEILEWYFANITGFATQEIVFNVTGAGNYQNDFVIGVRTPPVSGEVFG